MCGSWVRLSQPAEAHTPPQTKSTHYLAAFLLSYEPPPLLLSLIPLEALFGSPAGFNRIQPEELRQDKSGHSHRCRLRHGKQYQCQPTHARSTTSKQLTESVWYIKGGVSGYPNGFIRVSQWIPIGIPKDLCGDPYLNSIALHYTPLDFIRLHWSPLDSVGQP